MLPLFLYLFAKVNFYEYSRILNKCQFSVFVKYRF